MVFIRKIKAGEQTVFSFVFLGGKYRNEGNTSLRRFKFVRMWFYHFVVCHCSDCGGINFL